MGSQQQAVYFKNRGQNQGELVIKSSRGVRSIGKEISNHVSSLKVLKNENQLQENVNGEYELRDNTAYRLDGFLTVDKPIRLGNSTPIIGGHGSTDGLIHVGQSDLFRGTNKGLFLRNCYFHAPGGTIFNLTGDIDTEMLVESCAFSDAVGLGNIGSLGTIDGFRIPSFKGCNFENFVSGLTLTGNPDKVFFSESPFRGVDVNGVTILEFDSNFSTDVVDLTDCYIKGVQSDTEVIRVDSSATISKVFQYRGTTHDSTVTQSNILNGQAAVSALRFNVRDSYPLKESGIIGSLDYDSPNALEEITGSGSSATIIDIPTTTTNAERVSQQSNGILRYDATFDSKMLVNISSSVLGANTIAELAITKNGLPAAGRTEIRDTVKSNDASVMTTTGVFECEEGDTISTTLENVDESTDLSVSSLQLTVVGV